MSCRIFQRVIDERSGRTVEELIRVMDGDHSPGVALSMFFADEDPLPGTYVAECQSRGRLRTATLTYERSAA